MNQYRPTFSSFDQVKSALTDYEREWSKTLAAHKKAARAKK